MEFAKIDKKGQVIIPRSVLKAAGIAEESPVVLEATTDGAIVIRHAAIYPVEIYTDDRALEFEEANTIPSAVARRVEAHLRKKRVKR